MLGGRERTPGSHGASSDWTRSSAEWKEAAQARSGVSHGDSHYEAQAGIALVIVLKIKIKTGPGPVGTQVTADSRLGPQVSQVPSLQLVSYKEAGLSHPSPASPSYGGVPGLTLM